MKDVWTQALQNYYELAPSKLSPAMLQRLLDADLADETRGQKRQEHVLGLVARNHTLTAPGISDLIDRQTIRVLPSPICAAFSKPPNTIVVGDGLIDLLTACGYWSALVGALPKSADEVYPLEKHPKIPLSDALAVYTYALLYRYHEHGEPLPDFRALAHQFPNPNLDTQVRDAIAGAVMYILLHELGHLALGHHEGNDVSLPFDPPALIGEALTLYQQRELEADLWAMEAIRPDLRKIHTAWINMGLSFHFQRGALLSEASESHPLYVNRLAFAHACTDEQLRAAGDMDAHLIRMASAHENIERNNEKRAAQGSLPFLSSLTREEILDQIESLATLIPLDVSPVLASEIPTWHTCFEGSE
ncbi:MAG: hypothetical protein AAF515_16755 [Pseudomonadota bacterium]